MRSPLLPSLAKSALRASICALPLPLGYSLVPGSAIEPKDATEQAPAHFNEGPFGDTLTRVKAKFDS